MKKGIEKWDAIVVGGGLAGLSAAYEMARKGLEVMVVERGAYCGAKNVSGGRLYGHSLEKMIPDFAKEAPIERRIVRERLALLTEDGGTVMEYGSGSLDVAPSYSVNRSEFDQWMARKAEEAGVLVITGITVRELQIEEGKICGICSDGDVFRSDVVILADGVNSLLAQQIGMKKEWDPAHVAVGVKEVIKLDAKKINMHFGLKDGEGTALMATGYVTGGKIGGGFLYTNKDTVSLGIVTTVGDTEYSDVAVHEMVERFEQHPMIQPLVQEGKVVEYSAHLVPEGGMRTLPTLVGDGVLLTGDAAGLVMNLGFTVRGMDLAIESGRLAAEAVSQAKSLGDFSQASLSQYETLLNESFVMRDMKQYQNFPGFMASSHRLYDDYSQMADTLLAQLYVVDGSRQDDILTKAARAAAKVGLVNLALDGIRGLGAL